MMKTLKIAGLMAIVISTSACVSSDKVSQNAIEAPRPYVIAEQVSQKLDLPYEKVAPMQISQFDAEKLLDISAMAELTNPVPIVSRNAPLNHDVLVALVKPTYNVVDVIVEVPSELTVSEANRYLPRADIVWREDPMGDRREQVKVIIENAVRVGTASFNGNTDVIVAVKVAMFHALSQKARYSIGGRHNIRFDYIVYDAISGEKLAEVGTIDLKFKAYGGRKAIDAEARGETQKVRVIDHVSRAIRDQLGAVNAL